MKEVYRYSSVEILKLILNDLEKKGKLQPEIHCGIKSQLRNNNYTDYCIDIEITDPIPGAPQI